jgi:Flp pilus assembly pilin Flp
VSQEIEIRANKSKLQRIKHFFKREENGATAVEYAILVGVISIALIAGGLLLKDSIGVALKKANCAVNGQSATVTGTTVTCS